MYLSTPPTHAPIQSLLCCRRGERVCARYLLLLLLFNWKTLNKNPNKQTMGVDVTFLAEGDGKLSPTLLCSNRVDRSADG